MSRSIPLVSLVVRDYDEAIAFFTRAMRFHVVEDTPLGNGKRWVVVSPSGQHGASLLLARAANDEQLTHVGNQTGDRVSFFLNTNDFWGDYQHLQSCGVTFIEEPREEPYGTVVVFRDLYGNKWDLVQRKQEAALCTFTAPPFQRQRGSRGAGLRNARSVLNDCLRLPDDA